MRRKHKRSSIDYREVAVKAIAELIKGIALIVFEHWMNKYF